MTALPDRRCTLHIGMHQTGSTAVQNAFFKAAPPGITYVHAGSANSSPAVQTAFRVDAAQAQVHQLGGTTAAALAQARERALQAFEQALSAPGDRHFMFSAEAFTLLSAEELVQVREFVRPHVTQIDVVGYVREPVGYVQSHFQQQVKVGMLDRFDLPTLVPRYRERFEKFDQVFGAEHVRLWPHDPETFPPGGAVADFCMRLGLEPPAPEPAASDSAGGGSLSVDAIRMIYILRRYGPPMEPGERGRVVNRRLVKMLTELPGRPMRLAMGLRDDVLELAADDIAWVEQRMGEALPQAKARADGGGIHSEADLLLPSQKAIDWLAEKLKLPPEVARRRYPPKRLAEVLTRLVEHIGRRADRQAENVRAA